jgi:nucleoside-diphosphate-sugar epimerase
MIDRFDVLPSGSRVLVTGAAGFLGARAVDCLLGMPSIEVVGLVRRKPGRRAQAVGVHYVEGGMLNEAAVDEASRSADYVFHCAYDPRDPASNITGTENLIASSRKAGVTRFVHVSSFAVYQPFPEHFIDETTRDGDRSIDYVDIKLKLEKLVIEATKAGDLQGTIIQPAIVFGPRCWAWSRAPADLLRRRNVVLPDNGEGRCNLVYVDDVVQAMVLAAVSPAAVGQRFLISGAETLTWRDYYSAIAAELGVPGPLDLASLSAEVRTLVLDVGRVQPATWRSRLPEYLSRLVSKAVPDRSVVHGTPPELFNMFMCHAAADITLARSRLGYEPRFTLQQGLQQMHTYHLQEFGARKLV